MRLIASDFYTYHRPSECTLRVYLRHRGEEESAPGPYEQVIRLLGQRHERTHLGTFPSYVDLSSGTPEERERRTREEVRNAAPVIYQPLFRVAKQIDGVDCEIVGEPDFLILDAKTGQYVIRDSKISRRITEKDHPEILLQLGLYGWLYEQIFGRPASALQVHSGSGSIEEIVYDGGRAALDVLQEILQLKQSATEPYSPVGWTKCGGCGFHERCWPKAEEKRDVALVAGVDKGLARALRERGVETVDALLAELSEDELSGIQRPWGKKHQRVGKRAASIIRMARAMASGEECVLERPAVPVHPNYVMFDLEGLPPHLDELEKIYLWGLQVFGGKPSKFRAAVAGFGVDGDREGWERFLEEAKRVFDEYGDLPFVHWHHYERSRLDMYVDRFGDRGGVAARVRANLLDLLPIVQRSIALPLPSYSLKVVEGYVGFKRTQEEYGGEWAMAKYIEATETEDETLRAEVVDKILVYNQEDLQATWAVLEWLRSKDA